MAESYGFFNSAEGDVRAYSSENYAELFQNFFTSGIANAGSGIGLKVVVNSGLNVYVQAGYAMLQGHYYKNDGNLSLTLDTASISLNRIDRVVLRLDTTDRTINAVVKKGTLASTPVAPSLQRDVNIYEISLAQLRVNKNATASTITDERLNTSVCGIVSVAGSQTGSRTFVSSNVPSIPVTNDIWIDI